MSIIHGMAGQLMTASLHFWRLKGTRTIKENHQEVWASGYVIMVIFLSFLGISHS